MISLRKFESQDKLDQLYLNLIQRHSENMLRAGEYKYLSEAEIRAETVVQKNLPTRIEDLPNWETVFDVCIEDKKMIVGVIWCTFPRETIRNEARLSYIYIKPEYRGHGYAYQAISLLETQCKIKKIASIKLSLFSYNSHALSLYKRMGFEVIARKNNRIEMKKNLLKGAEDSFT